MAELAEVLGPAGFEFIQTGRRHGNASPFASGEFLRGDRRLELHVRSLADLVRYHFGDESLSHEDLVRAFARSKASRRRASTRVLRRDPMAGFRHLRHDLERFGAIFLRGGAKAFRALKKWVNKHPRKSGFAGLGP